MGGKALRSQRIRVNDYDEASSVFLEKEWADGLPIVAPTADKVSQFLDYAHLEPDYVVGQIPERNVKLTAEKIAINAVMAGCLPEYMPVIVAAIEALTAPEYKFNHMASLASPWPLIIVSGPVVKKLGINTGSYLFGCEDRPNATIGRAISLLFRNCTEARRGRLQAGQWGNVLRGGGCVIGENEDVVPWTPHRVLLGFPKEANTVTVMSTFTPPFKYWCATPDAKMKLDVTAIFLSMLGFYRSTYQLLVPPNMAKVFHDSGWTKEAVRDYLKENTKASIAFLKRTDRFGWGAPDFSKGDVFTGDSKVFKIEPEDEQKYAYLFHKNPEYDRYLYGPSDKDLPMEIYVIVCGGPGPFLVINGMYQVSTRPVTKVIRTDGA